MSKPLEIDPEEFGFLPVGEMLRPDERGRIPAKKTLEKSSVSANHPDGYRSYVNEFGQILLDPVVTVPARERWLHRNPVAFAALKAGIASVKSGGVVPGPQFKEFAQDEDD